MDVFNINTKPENNATFFANGSAWQIWNKPKNANFVYFFLIGGGGGGGGGKSSSLNSAVGGGGGGCSSITTALYPAALLPDTIYINIGLGGLGGAGGTGGGLGVDGFDGNLSYLCYEPNLTAINILLKSGDIAAGGGGRAFSTTGVGAGGTAGTAWTFATAINGNTSLITSVIGQNGTSGVGVGATPTNLTPILPISGGAGGGAVSAGGTAFAGGGILGSGFFNPILTGVPDAANQTINGVAGFTYLPMAESMDIPMFFSGGSGGAGAGTTGRAGGNGGVGSYGSGGGGGAGSYNGAGGSGGNGGDGLSMIVTL